MLGEIRMLKAKIDNNRRQQAREESAGTAQRENKMEQMPACRQGDDTKATSENLTGIRHTVIVLSGKGGVGKSTVAVNLASALTLQGKKVGLLDIDFHGPTVPTMLDLAGKADIQLKHGKIQPVQTRWGLKTISLGFLLRDQDDAVIWRGPLKTNVIRQLLRDVKWGDLDYLLIDCPPGTGDEPLSIVQTVSGSKGAVIVTTPQEVSLAAVRKSITFCKSLKLPVLGLVENMSGFHCPHCGKISHFFTKGGGVELAQREALPLLGRIPLLMEISSSGDNGLPVALERNSEAGEIFRKMVAILDDVYCNQETADQLQNAISNPYQSG